ncbi:MAG TPA: hypothetical protein VFX98_04015 [Longimicrobiaceae bacterium]|nr:hypothetical protein [Longimicrobiaceae bacterium]
MSHTFTDEDLLTWEAYASGGKYGLGNYRPTIVFNCISDPGRRPRFVVQGGDNADAEEAVQEMSDQELRDLFREAKELD